MRITKKYLMVGLLSALPFSGLTGTAYSTQVITASGSNGHSGGSAKVRVTRPPVSASDVDGDAPDQVRAETRIIIQVPVYVTARRIRNSRYWRYRAAERALGPNYPGFRREYFGPRYPF